MMTSQLDTLTQINLDDLVSAFGWQNIPPLAWLIKRAFLRPARKFARQMVEFDELVAKGSLAQASRTIMQKQYVRDVCVHGSEHIPTKGAALFLSNHPGMADTISLFAAINRTDLKIIALHRPFLEALKNTTTHLFFIDDDPAKRMNAVRGAANHLRNGGSALTFPAGEIEPDPLVYPGALDSLSRWTDSAGVFLRFAPDLRIVPVVVSGVIWDKAARHPLTRLKRTRAEREKLAAALQLLALVTRDARPNTVHVQFAKPITLEEVGSTASDAIHAKVIERTRALLGEKIESRGKSVLW
jgi:1-acyl-sn-glycerol-3-phosphate acyltransferase